MEGVLYPGKPGYDEQYPLLSLPNMGTWSTDRETMMGGDILWW